MSIIIHELFDESKSYGIDNISDNFSDVMDTLTMVSCYLGIGTRKWDRLYSPLDVFDSAAKGTIDIEKENELDIAETIFSGFFTSINSDIKRVYYDRTYNDNTINYTLTSEKTCCWQISSNSLFKRINR